MTEITTDTIKNDVADFILASFLYEIGKEGIEGDTNLFEAGVMDSYSLVELSSFIESTYGVDIEDNEMISPELTTYDGIVSFIERKTKAKAA